MKKEDLKKKLDGCFKNAIDILENQGELVPMLDIDFKDSNDKDCIIAVVLADGNNKERRDKFIAGLGVLFGSLQALGKIKEVNCIVMMSEAWVSVVAKDKEFTYKMPSQDPKRREMIIATGLTPDGLCQMLSKEMFSTVVKGKRYFRLEEMKEMVGVKEPESFKSNVLENFTDAYNGNKNKEVPEKFAPDKLVQFSLEDILKRGIEVLMKDIGGLEGKFVDINK